MLESYTHYLYHIGKDSLPNAFVLIAEKFGDTPGANISFGSPNKLKDGSCVAETFANPTIRILKSKKGERLALPFCLLPLRPCEINTV